MGVRKSSDYQTTKVIFRVFKGDGVHALFPEEPGTDDPATCLSFSLAGQHSAIDMNKSLHSSRYATMTQAQPLIDALTRRGYKLRVVYRTPPESRQMREAKINTGVRRGHAEIPRPPGEQ